MYCKLFASLYQGTLRGRSNEILVFTNLLAHCSKDGIVDKHFRAIAEETGLSVDEVKAAITVLESPDIESRSPENGGARLLRLDEHRVWGWRVVNYGKYRAIRSEEDRAEQNRLAQQRWREKNKPSSAGVSRDKPRSAQAEGEVEGEATNTALPWEGKADAPPRKKEAETKSAHTALIAAYYDAYLECVGEKYIVGGRDVTRLKVFLGVVKNPCPENVAAMIRSAFAHRAADRFCSACKKVGSLAGFFDNYSAIAAELKATGKTPSAQQSPEKPSLRMAYFNEFGSHWQGTNEELQAWVAANPGKI